MRALALLVLLALGCSAAGRGGTRDTPDPATADARIRTVEAFREARERGELGAARALLVDDPRVWYDAVKGEGAPWRLEGGRWRGWDEHFRGRSVRTSPWHPEAGRVWADMAETNDYFRLTESSSSRWRATYLFAEDGRIRGFVVSGVPGRKDDRGRRDEFEAWARACEPDEAEYLMPGGAIDPSGDRPPRMRALLERWRAAAGLGPLAGNAADDGS